MTSIVAKELKLSSPFGTETIIYHWPLVRAPNYNGAAEIVENIKLVCNECPDLKHVVSGEIDHDSYESMKALCDKFNRAASVYKTLNKGTAKFPINEYASPALLKHIVQQVYNRSVVEPEKLNQYEPFTPAVYGETSFELISKMIEIVKPTEDDVFIDLGSGVGQIVAQMAGGAKCKKCYGIEKADVPASYARSVDVEFRKWMKWYGKKISEFEIIEGDFLDSNLRELIMGCSLIFVNNFAFGPAVDHKLKQIFAEMHDGTKIVSSKKFCPLNFRISDRNLSDIGTIMNVSELWSQKDSVSWTDKEVTYYLHVIDRKKLEHYFASMHNNGGNGSRPELKRSGSKASCRSSVSRDSGSSNAEFPAPSLNPIPHGMEERENIYVGTTTRRQYASWLAQQGKQRKEPRSSSSKSSISVISKRRIASVGGAGDGDADAGSTSTRAVFEISSETTEERETDEMDEVEEDGDDDEEARGDPDSEDEENTDQESGRTGGDGSSSGSPRKSKSSAADLARRPPGRPRKSHVALKAQQAKKKYQKQGRPGRPSVKKSTSKKSQEWRGALDFMHRQIQHISQSGGEATTSRAVAMSPDQSPTRLVEPTMPMAPLDNNCNALHPEILAKAKAHCEKQTALIVNFLSYMQTPQFHAQLIEDIEREQAKKRQLTDRAGQLERQISKLQEDGVQCLRTRMAEVGIQAESPAELLNKAKEIVMHHQALQSRANTIDSELHELNKQNDYLVSQCRERDEQVIRSGLLQNMGYNGLSPDETKTAIVRDIGLLFNRRRALMVEMTKMEGEIHTLEANIPPSINTEALLSQLPPIGVAAMGGGAVTPIHSPIGAARDTPAASTPASIGQVTTGVGAKKRGSNSAAPKRKTPAAKANRSKPKANPGTAVGITQMATTVASTTPTGATTSTTGTTAAATTTVASGATSSADDGTQEDIEKKIQDIVRKALSVDNAAKRAEKERKARTAERKRGGKSATTAAVGGTPVGTTTTVDKGQKVYPTLAASPSKTGGTNSSKDTESESIVATRTGIEQTIFDVASAGGQPMEQDRPPSNASSATESAPSDHEDFQMDEAPTEHQAVATMEATPLDAPTPIKPRFKKTSVSAIRSSANVVEQQQRPSSVPVSQTQSFAGSQFSISSLIAAAAMDTTTGSSGTAESTTIAYPRVSSAFARIEHIPSTITTAAMIDSESIGQSAIAEPVTSLASSAIDSGFTTEETRTTTADESLTATTSTITTQADLIPPVGDGEPTTSSVPYPTAFKGTSANVGQPGNPHSFSNPGNPLDMEVDFPKREGQDVAYSNPFKGTSNTGNAGNPHDYSNPGNPSTPPDEVDFNEPKVLQPFRIPRRAVKDVTADSPDTRSPLAQVGGRKEEMASSSWMPTSSSAGIGVRKRRRDLESSPSKRRLVIPDTTVIPFDQIMNAMIVPNSGTPAMKKPSRSRSIHSETSSNESPKKFDPFAPTSRGIGSLTKETLERHAASQEVHSFAEKGLMEALLEHKMAAGRIESHNQIANKLRFAAGKKKAVGGPGTPPGSPRGGGGGGATMMQSSGGGNRRGPKTPENTPPSSPTRSTRSHSSRRSNFSGVSALEPDSLSGQHPPPSSLMPQISTGTISAATPTAVTATIAERRESRSPSTSNNTNSAARTLETLARLTNIDAGQLAKCLNEDALRTLQDIDPALLVATLGTLLSTVAKSVRPGANRPDDCGSSGGGGGGRARDKSEELVTSTSMVEDKSIVHVQQQQPVEMEIASSHSGGSPAPPPDDSDAYGGGDQAAYGYAKMETSAQFQPHQLFQPLFSMPPPALGLPPPPAHPLFMAGQPPPPAPPSLPAFNPPIGMDSSNLGHQQQHLMNLFMLMQMMQGGGGMVNNEDIGGSSDRDLTRLVKDYYHGDERRRGPSPEPMFTMPPPPKPVRVDYSYSTPRELAVIRAPPRSNINEAQPPRSMLGPPPPLPPANAPLLMNDMAYLSSRRPPPSPPSPPSHQAPFPRFGAPPSHLQHHQQQHQQQQRPYLQAPAPPPVSMPPLPFGGPPMPMSTIGGGGIPSLLDMDQPFPPFGGFRPQFGGGGGPPPSLQFGRGGGGAIGLRGNRGGGQVRHFRP